MKSAARRIIRSAGFDVIRFRQGTSSADGRRTMAMRRRGINLVIDVGANVGQYAQRLRSSGYRGDIVSFEPLPGAFSSLSRVAARDRAWTCFPIALGSVESRATLNVAGNSVSSSLLPMLDRHLSAAPASVYRETVDVEVRPLDELLDDLRISEHRTLLKLDVQGYERSVIEGAARSFEFIDLVELELSFVPLYRGQPLFQEMIDLVEQQGFGIVSLDPGFADPHTGQLLQCDAIFEQGEVRSY